MKEILGYAFMIAISAFTLVVGVASLMVEKDPYWVGILMIVVGFLNLFGWVAGAQYNLNNSKKGDDKNEDLDR